jgi:hypothetical protein
MRIGRWIAIAVLLILFCTVSLSVVPYYAIENEGLVFVSNGDGTCTLADVGSVKDGTVVVPEYNSLGEAVTVIGQGAFRGSRNIDHVELPSGIQRIEAQAFYGCSSLLDIVLPPELTVLGDSVFENCTVLQDVTIPHGVLSIGKNCFKNCDSLLYLQLPDSVTEMGAGVFYGCDRLTSVLLPASLTELPSQSFAVCPSLTGLCLCLIMDGLGVLQICFRMQKILQM